MVGALPPLPDPALEDFLDEVVVPTLVARFVREYAAATEPSERKDRSVSLINDSETLAPGSRPG